MEDKTAAKVIELKNYYRKEKEQDEENDLIFPGEDQIKGTDNFNHLSR